MGLSQGKVEQEATRSSVQGVTTAGQKAKALADWMGRKLGVVTAKHGHTKWPLAQER